MDRFRGRRRLLALVVVFVGAVTPSARAATATVIERGVEYVPKQVNITVGDTVVWVYESGPNGASHTVTFDNGPDLHPTCNGLIFCQNSANPRVQRTFTSAGTFAYHCRLHGGPGGKGMAGVVVVDPASTTSSTSAFTTSSTLPRATTTSSTAKASTSSTPATTRPLATSSTLSTSSTTSTTSDTSSVLLPGDPPPFSGDDVNSAAGRSGGSDDGSDSGTVVLIVGLLLAVSAAGGYLLWRLRPGRA